MHGKTYRNIFASEDEHPRQSVVGWPGMKLNNARFGELSIFAFLFLCPCITT
jgi:hypothetical protein